jgi:hypothetical protein
MLPLKSVSLKSSLNFLVLFTLVFSSLVLRPSTSAAKTAITFEEYYKQCLARIQNAGIQGKLAQDICSCTIATFKKRYSLDEFNRVVEKSKADKATAKLLAEVGETCFEKYLYEE